MEKVFSSTPSTRLAWILTLTCAFYFFYVIVDGTLLNVIGSDIIKTFSLTSTELGTFASVYLWSNALWLIPAGLIYDKYPTRYIIISTFFMCIVATFVFAYSSWLWLDIICRLVAGMGSAFGFLGCLRIAVMLFSPQRSAAAIGMVITLGMSGGIFTNLVFVHLVIDLGWRTGLVFFAGLGLIFLLLIIIALQTSTVKNLENRKHINEQVSSLREKIWIVLKNGQNWIIGIYIGLLNLPMMMLAPLWLSWYLRQVYNLDLAHAASLTSILFLGEIIGASLVGWIANKLMAPRALMFIGAFLSMLVTFVIIYIPHLNIHLLFGMLFSLGFLVSVQVLGYPLIAQHNQSAYVSTAQGVASTLVNIISALSKPLFGWLLALHWIPTYRNGLPFYQISNYNVALLMLPVGFILAMILCVCIRSKKAVSAFDIVTAGN